MLYDVRCVFSENLENILGLSCMPTQAWKRLIVLGASFFYCFFFLFVLVPHSELVWNCPISGVSFGIFLPLSGDVNLNVLTAISAYTLVDAVSSFSPEYPRVIFLPAPYDVSKYNRIPRLSNMMLKRK